MDKNIDFLSSSFIFKSSLFTKNGTNIRKTKDNKKKQKDGSFCIFLKKHTNLVETGVL